MFDPLSERISRVAPGVFEYRKQPGHVWCYRLCHLLKPGLASGVGEDRVHGCASPRK